MQAPFNLKINRALFLFLNQIILIQSQLGIFLMSKNKTPQPKKYQTKQAQTKLEIKKETEIQKYLKQLSSKTKSLQKVIKDAQKGEKNILTSIKKGKLEIKDTPKDLSTLIFQQKIDNEQQKAQQLRKKRQQIIQAIQRLDMRKQKSSQTLRTVATQYNNTQLVKIKPEGIFTKQQHQAHVQKIKQTQLLQDQRNEQMLYRLQKKLQQNTQKQKKLQQQRFNSQKQLRRRQSQYKLSLRQQINEFQNAEEQRSKRQILQIKKKNHLHQILQQKFYNSIVIPGLEQKKKKLKQIREINKSFKIKDIDNHQKKYLHQRSKSMQLFQSKAKVSQQWVYKAPQKTQKFGKLLEEQLSNHKKQLQKDQKALQQKILRQDNYIRLLKQKHIPTVDQNKHQQIIARIQKIHTKRREITKEPKQVGKDYLIQAKKMKKYESQPQFKPINEINEEASKFQSSRVNYLVRKHSKQFFAEKRKEIIDKIMQSENDDMEKLKKLQIQNRKVQQASKRKLELLQSKGGTLATRADAADLLLSGIQAKMGLIKLVN